MSEHLVEYFYYVFVIFSLVILTVIFGFTINDFINSSYDEKLESFCNQLHDTHSCSIVYENDDVVLFDTYNGYVTMENILK